MRQAQDIAKAKPTGVYKGRPVDFVLRKRVRELLNAALEHEQSLGTQSTQRQR